MVVWKVKFFCMLLCFVVVVVLMVCKVCWIVRFCVCVWCCVVRVVIFFFILCCSLIICSIVWMELWLLFIFRFSWKGVVCVIGSIIVLLFWCELISFLDFKCEMVLWIIVWFIEKCLVNFIFEGKCVFGVNFLLWICCVSMLVIWLVSVVLLCVVVVMEVNVDVCGLEEEEVFMVCMILCRYWFL